MMSRFIMLMVLCLSLFGCGITQSVTGLVVDSEVKNLQPAIGKNIQTARAMATRSGFSCDSEPERSTENSDGVKTTRDYLTCNKKPALIYFCPERRFVTFIADSKTGKVINIRTEKRETCF